MCLAIPVRVEEVLPDELARVDAGGVKSVISLALVEDVVPGDYVILHVGFAIARLDAAEAAKTLSLFGEIAAHIAKEEARGEIYQ
jgi:hydrogenase expression/formation protein HypC